MIAHTLNMCAPYISCIFDNIFGIVELRHYYVYTTVGVLTLFICVICNSNSFIPLYSNFAYWLFTHWRCAPATQVQSRVWSCFYLKRAPGQNIEQDLSNRCILFHLFSMVKIVFCIQLSFNPTQSLHCSHTQNRGLNEDSVQILKHLASIDSCVCTFKERLYAINTKISGTIQLYNTGS